jgi:hypothetical protein
MLGTTHPAKQHHIAEDWKPHFLDNFYKYSTIRDSLFITITTNPVQKNFFLLTVKDNNRTVIKTEVDTHQF